MPTSYLTEYCVSDGSILVKSDVVSFSTRTSGDANDQAQEIPSGAKQRQLACAPFYNPSSPLSDADPSKTRRTIFVRDLGDPKLSLTASIPVALDFWEGSVTACCYDLEEFGVGEDEFSAIADLKASLAELYFLLKAESQALGPRPQQQWDYLRSIAREN